MKRYYPDKGELPLHGEYVLAYFPGRPWNDGRSGGLNTHKLKVVRFQRGLSKVERAALPNDLVRKRTYQSSDEEANNQRPYNWHEFGPGSFFGQECKFWCHLSDPEAPEEAEADTDADAERYRWLIKGTNIENTFLAMLDQPDWMKKELTYKQRINREIDGLMT